MVKQRWCRIGSRCLLVTLLALIAMGAAAQNDPVPFNTVARGTAQDVVEEMVVEGLGKIPLGRIPVALYKVADFTREIGEAAVEKEDATRGAQIVLLNADAALIHGLVMRGEGNSPKAQAAKARLRDLRDRLDSQDPGDMNYLLNTTAKHFNYAVGRVSLQHALGLGFKRLLSSDPVMRFIRKYLGLGSRTAPIIGISIAARTWSQEKGWEKFDTRAEDVKRRYDHLADILLDIDIQNRMAKELGLAASNALAALHDRVMGDHPPKPVVLRRARLELAINPAMYAAPIPVMPAMVLVPAPVAAQVIPVQPRLLRVEDPQAQAIYVEDSHVQNDWRWPSSSQPDTYRSPPVASPEPEPEPEPEPPSERDLERHQELMCVGAGNKPGCERWNSTSGPSVEGNWDGRSDGSLHD